MSAIDIGYRHIDCAYDYQNYAEVGEGIKTKIAEGKITREELFYTDKVRSRNFKGRMCCGGHFAVMYGGELLYLRAWVAFPAWT